MLTGYQGPRGLDQEAWRRGARPMMQAIERYYGVEFRPTENARFNRHLCVRWIATLPAATHGKGKAFWTHYGTMRQGPDGVQRTGKENLRRHGFYVYKTGGRWRLAVSLPLAIQLAPDEAAGLEAAAKTEPAACVHVGYDRIREEARAWLDDTAPVPVPDGFDLRATQRQAYEFCVRRMRIRGGAMNGTDMGGGKTRVAAAIIRHFAPPRVLWLAPKAALYRCAEEMEACGQTAEIFVCAPPVEGKRWRHATVTSLQGSDAYLSVQDTGLLWQQEQIVCCTYQLLATGWRFGAWHPDMIVLDECHLSKSDTAKITDLLRQVAPQARYRLMMSGTPVAHSGRDMFTEARILDPSLFATDADALRAKAAWKCIRNPKPTMQGRADCIAAFARVVATWCVIPDTDAEIRLPPCADETLAVDPDAVMQERMAAVAANAARFDDGGRRTRGELSLTRRMRLSQVTGGQMLDETDVPCGEMDEHSPKAKAMQALFAAHAESGDPLIVFTRFVPEVDAALAWARAAGLRAYGLHDGLHGSLMRPDADCLVANGSAGAEGIDLTRAAHLVFYSVPDSMAKYYQCRKRIHRPGQTQACRVTHIVARGTVDESVMANIATRRELAMAIMAESSRRARQWAA